MSGPVLQLRAITKHYGAVHALDDVDLDIASGEVIAICGDNGAGKSTLIRVISGAQPPTSGTLALDGEIRHFRSPADALAAGIATTYQDLALAPRLSIAQNVFMGGELTRGPRRLGLLDKRRMRAEARRYLDQLRFTVHDMDRPVTDLSGGQRQAVALARALRWQARIVIMDEPTAALGVAESAQVRDLIRSLNAQGVTIILVSHDMDDVVALAQRVVILKRGRLAGALSTDGLGADRLAQMIMTGIVPN